MSFGGYTLELSILMIVAQIDYYRLEMSFGGYTLEWSIPMIVAQIDYYHL